AVLGLGGQRMLERERPYLLGQAMLMATHHRTERAAAAAKQVGAHRAVTSTACALLGVHLLAGAIDVGAVLHRVRTGALLGELPPDAALEEVGARLEAEDRIREVDGARLGVVESRDLQFHLTHPLWLLSLRPAQPPRRPAGGTSRAAALPLAASSSPR